jgi:hypothetical protein
MSRILGCRVELSSLGWERGMTDIDKDNDHSGFIQRGEIVQQLTEYQLLKDEIWSMDLQYECIISGGARWPSG